MPADLIPRGRDATLKGPEAPGFAPARGPGAGSVERLTVTLGDHGYSRTPPARPPPPRGRGARPRRRCWAARPSPTATSRFCSSRSSRPDPMKDREAGAAVSTTARTACAASRRCRRASASGCARSWSTGRAGGGQRLPASPGEMTRRSGVTRAPLMVAETLLASSTNGKLHGAAAPRRRTRMASEENVTSSRLAAPGRAVSDGDRALPLARAQPGPANTWGSRISSRTATYRRAGRGHRNPRRLAPARLRLLASAGVFTSRRMGRSR